MERDIRIAGRAAQQRQCADALDAAASASTRVEIVGEPGIGKSTLFEDTVAEARARGFRVLLARPNRAESGLAYAGLADLLADVDLGPDPGDAGLAGALTPPERRTLDIALGRAHGDANPISTRVLGAAVAATLRAIAESSRTLVAIDDLQWLDASTAEAFAFALRRLPERNVTVLVARRPVGDDVFSAHEQIHLQPLTAEAARDLAAHLASSPMSTAVIDRIVDTAGGNPLYVAELMRSLSSGAPQMIVPLPMPASLRQLVADRLKSLPDATVEALAMIALLAAPTVDALAPLGVLGDLAPAERADIIELTGRSVSFRHPLLASAAHDAVPGSRRLQLHRRLADVTTGLERCIHLAFGTDHADATVADELAASLPDLIGRGAFAEAADLAALALSITPADDPALQARMLVCGDTAFRAGRTREALEHLERARRTATSPDLVARALLGLATIEYSHTDNAESSIELAMQALDLTDDPVVLAEAHTILSRVLYTDFVAAADHAAAALAQLQRLEAVDDLALAMALNASASANFMAGRGLDREMFVRAIDLERGSSVSAADSAAGAFAALLKYADELDEARERLYALVDDADDGSLPYVLGHLPQLELWTGNWEAAERAALRQLELARAADQESQVQGAHFNLTIVRAFRGELDDAIPLAQALEEEGRTTGALWTERNGAALLGFLAMSRGDADEAVRCFGRYDEIGEAMGLFEPGYTRFNADYVEALVAVGDIDRAEALLERVEPRAVRLDRPSAIGVVLRGRALVAAHRGDVDAAIDAARAAVEVTAATSLVYDHARALLTLGVVLRRFKLRAEARAALTPALELFEQMGAQSLAERVRLELSRLGVRTTTSLDLTETESRVAQLAAGGRTTRQIADALFISVKTVEANMTRIYRKLGVANRAELANLLGAGAEAPGSGDPTGSDRTGA